MSFEGRVDRSIPCFARSVVDIQTLVGAWWWHLRVKQIRTLKGPRVRSPNGCAGPIGEGCGDCTYSLNRVRHLCERGLGVEITPT